MKVLLITSGYNRIARSLISNKEIELVGVAFTRQRNKKTQLKTRIANIVFDISCRIFRILRSGKRLPVFFLYKDNQKALVEWSKKLNTDLTIVYSSPFIFIDELVHSSPLGTINIHPSLLPKYRGPQPLLWQYLDFDLNAGVTIHYIAKKEDTGDIIMQREFKIAIGTPYIQTVHNSENIGYQMIIDVMESIEKGQYTRIKQPEHSSTERAYRIDKKTIFERIQWEEWSVERIYHLLSGMFTAAELSKYAAELPLDKDLKIKGYSNNSHYPLSEVGKVIKHEKGFNIVCKNGLIQIAQNVVNMFVIVEVLNNI